MPATSTTTGIVTLRPAAASDREFLVALYATSREAELAQVAWAPGQREWFVTMQFDAQDGDYRSRFAQASFSVVEVEGRSVGRLYVDRNDAEIHLIDITLMPAVRDAGLGTGLIRGLQDEASATDRAVTLHVDGHNRAQSLYARLGFTHVAERDPYRLLEWRAG